MICIDVPNGQIRDYGKKECNELLKKDYGHIGESDEKHPS